MVFLFKIVFAWNNVNECILKNTDVYTHVFPTQGGLTAFTINIGDCV